MTRKPRYALVIENQEFDGDLFQLTSDRLECRLTAFVFTIDIEIEGIAMSRSRFDMRQIDAVLGEHMQSGLERSRSMR